MARPHGKVLQGKEGGHDTQHWYNYIETKRAILRSKRWDGGGPACKSGTWWVIAKSLVKTEEPKS